VTIEHSYEQPIYTTVNEPYCPKDKVDSMNLTYNGVSKVIDFKPELYTYSFKDGVLTIKDLSRGGSWGDVDLDSCYNPGVPCQQISFIPIPERVVVEVVDIDKRVVLE
jgi:hypothetical protein